ncbi:hypothetical protein [Flavobacterium frigoris]|uniref:Lipocalin-like domain-containing protein n=1 Tax=Flavobacterium frigoris (strain PS1) TaxID=1086011 RepID=H7FN98_FLAFP|nr:hypothetical protein [Flavobacterium frigoris]EIA09887.1 hypothetical protein HJ01_00569 [Flavobacterium frigoris PS1]
MKKILFIILLVSLKVNSQQLVGNWKVVCYEDEICYFNKTTDSILYKDTTRKEEAENFRKMSDLIIFPITYNFDSNGNYTMTNPMIGKTHGKFKIDKVTKKIAFIDDENKKFEIPFEYKDEILFLQMKMENAYMKIGLKKN